MKRWEAIEEPATMRGLVGYIMELWGFRSLAEMSRKTSIPYSTLWAWQDGSRSASRPPSAEVLRTIAADFGISDALVFRAAGRVYTGDEDVSPRFLGMLRQLSPAQRNAIERMIRAFVSSPAALDEP